MNYMVLAKRRKEKKRKGKMRAKLFSQKKGLIRDTKIRESAKKKYRGDEKYVTLLKTFLLSCHLHIFFARNHVKRSKMTIIKPPLPYAVELWDNKKLLLRLTEFFLCSSCSISLSVPQSVCVCMACALSYVFY